MIAPREWHLICITRKGKVSMLKNLDLRSAREAYKRLLPDTRPEDHQSCEACEREGTRENRSYGGSGFWLGSCSSPSDEDRLEKIEALGPERVDFDPWHGVEPKIIVHCFVGRAFYASDGTRHIVLAHREPEPEWDSRRTDFWNNPKLWANIDPAQRKCWMPEDVQ